MTRLAAAFFSVVLACTPNTARAAEPAPAATPEPITVMFEGEVTDESVAAAIAALDSDPTAPVLMVLDTPGGSVKAGMALVKAFERRPGAVTCLVDGYAASMGMVILQGCDARLATNRSVIMMHGAGTGGVFFGQEHEWRNVAERLRVINEAMLRYECRRLTVPFETCAGWVADGKEKWMTPREALEVGALDGVIPAPAPAAPGT